MKQRDQMFDVVDNPYDPEKCKLTKCINRRERGKETCSQHSINKREQKKMYDIQRFNDRIKQLDQSEKSRTFTDEIAILRLTLEKVLNSCENNATFASAIPSINNLATNISKLVIQLNRNERLDGKMLDRSTALTLASEIVQIIDKHLADATIKERIADDIIQLVSNIQPAIHTKDM